MALANRLVGNDLLAPALEVTLAGMSFRADVTMQIAITGAIASCTVNGESAELHATLQLAPGDEVHVGPAEKGARSYVAFAGGLLAEEVFGSQSTYLPAGFAGFEGRALQKGDQLELGGADHIVEMLQSPAEFRPPMTGSWTIRAGRAPETGLLQDADQLFAARFTIGNRSDRMGLRLEGATFGIRSDGRMPSAPVFPGIIQCPEDGELFVLSVDAGTTGGYPRVAKVARLDLHVLGQLRPGDQLMLIERKEPDAETELRDKHQYWNAWLPGVDRII
jgi:allophanate hydrolase